MRLSIFRENDRVLLVGEGNFSFAASLVEHNLPIAITASCHESSAAGEIARENVEVLESHGARVLLGVDGTRLRDHPVLRDETFDRILFNFPHVGGKMRLDRNRELLRRFFAAAGESLNRDGTIAMTLCNGQGGTLADDPRRRWDDSWKVTEMAAHGNFVLTSVESFDVSNFPDYRSTGYRGLDKEFNVQKSLTHIFRRAQPPSAGNLGSTTKHDNSKIVEKIKYRDISPDSWRSLDSLCPPVFVFDITFTVSPDFRASDLYALLYNFAGRIVRDVEFVGSYEFPGREKMNCLRRLRPSSICGVIRKQENQIANCSIVLERKRSIESQIRRTLRYSACRRNEESTVTPLRSLKSKSRHEDTAHYFVDIKQVRATGGTGGDGMINFMRLWVNDRAGPDGGDGGHGGHVVFEVSTDVQDLKHINNLLKAENGGRGYGKDCIGKNAKHTVVKVPVGTIVRNTEGDVLADLDEPGMMFIAARGGAGGHGNAFFASDVQQSPHICEYGAVGEECEYLLEVRSMAHIGLIGLPNAGKSTLLRAITRARPKVASYAFTTLKPHLGMVLYDDYEQIAVADLPGLIEDSHKNRGLGVTFLKHAERCAALLFIIDLSQDEPWLQLDTLKNEIEQFSKSLTRRPMLVIANKIDLPEAKENLKELQERVKIPIIPISAKMGINVAHLLKEIRYLYDKELKKDSGDESKDT